MTTTRPYHHGNLRAALLVGAERTLRDRGLDDLSLRELAREVGVSHAAPRRHFADRQALLDALACDGFERLGADLAAAATGNGPFDARLAATARAYVAFATQHAALLEVMWAGKHRESDEAAVIREAGERAFVPVLGLVVEGQRDGHLDVDDPQGIGILAFATLQGIATLANRGMLPPDDLDAIVTAAIDRLLRGLRPR